MEKAIDLISWFLPRKSRQIYREAWRHDCKQLTDFGVSKFAFLIGLARTVLQIFLYSSGFLFPRLIILAIIGCITFELVRQGGADEDWVVLLASFLFAVVLRNADMRLRVGLFLIGVAEGLTFAMFATYPLRFSNWGSMHADNQLFLWLIENAFWLVSLLCFMAISSGVIAFTVWALTDFKSTFLLLIGLLDFGAFWLARWGVVVSSPQSEQSQVSWVQNFHKLAMFNYSQIHSSLHIVGVIGFIGLLWFHYRRSKRVVVI